MRNVICVSCNISGIGKTTTAVNLAASLAVFEKKTLVVDCNHPYDATISLKCDDHNRPVLSILNTRLKYLDRISDSSFSTVLYRKSFNKDDLFNHIEQLKNYEYIILDTSSQKNLITEKSVCISDQVVIPIQCLDGVLLNIFDFLRYIKEIRDKYNSNVKIAGLLFNALNNTDERRVFFKDQSNNPIKSITFETSIPFDRKIDSSTINSQIVCLNDICSRGSEAFLDFAYELLKKQEKES